MLMPWGHNDAGSSFWQHWGNNIHECWLFNFDSVASSFSGDPPPEDFCKNGSLLATAIDIAAAGILQGWVHWCLQSSAIPLQLFWNTHFFFGNDMINGCNCCRYFYVAVSAATVGFWEAQQSTSVSCTSGFWNALFSFGIDAFFRMPTFSLGMASNVDASAASPVGRMIGFLLLLVGRLIVFYCMVQQSTCAMRVLNCNVIWWFFSCLQEGHLFLHQFYHCQEGWSFIMVHC